MSLYTGPRYNEGWRWDLLDLAEQPLGPLEGVENGRLEFSIFQTVRTQGSLSWSGSTTPNWNLYRVQPWYHADTDDGPIDKPLGVYLMSTPGHTYGDAKISGTVDLYDKMLLLDQRKVTETYTVPAGAVVTSALRTLLTGYSVAIDDSTETLAAAQSFPAGTSYLQIANALLQTINYFGLYADGFGVFRCERYVAPRSRPIEWEFVDSQESVVAPGWSDEQDLFDVPNVFIGTARADGDAPALQSVARNDDPASPTSTVSRTAPGMPLQEFTRFEEGIEATSQAMLDSIVARRLIEASTTPLKMAVTHPQLPIDLNDAVMFANARRGIAPRLCVVQSIEMRSGLGAACTTNLLQVML